jgi:hypothetical protein
VADTWNRSILAVLVFGVLLVYWGLRAYDYLTAHNLISHTTVAVLTAKDWSIGEYRTCMQPNLAEMQNEPHLDCSGVSGYGEPRSFEVEFHGENYREDVPNAAVLTWRCKKNEGTDPSFTCDQQKVISESK